MGLEDEQKYLICLRVVSVFHATEEMRKASLYTLGLEHKDIKEVSDIDMAQCLVESSYGAMIWQSSGGNADKLMKQARKECDKIEGLLGFYLDKRLNFFGNTGWDFLKGQIGLEKKEKWAEVIIYYAKTQTNMFG